MSEAIKTIVRKLIHISVKNSKGIDLKKLRKKYNKNRMRIFVINVVDIDYSAVISVIDNIEIIAEGPIIDYQGYDEITVIVNTNAATVLDIADGKLDPMQAYMLHRIIVVKADPATMAADIKLFTKIFSELYNPIITRK